MDWDDIKVFLAVAESGSLRAAAAKLKVSQPTIGRRLLSLEHAGGGHPLFERTPQGHEPTARASALLPAARALAEAALAFERQVAGLTDTIAGTIRVAAHDWVNHLIAARAHRFREDLPGIKLELTDLRRGGGDLVRRDADIGVFEGPISQHTGADALFLRPMGALPFAIYAAPDLAKGAAFDPAARFTDCPGSPMTTRPRRSAAAKRFWPRIAGSPNASPPTPPACAAPAPPCCWPPPEPAPASPSCPA